MENKLKLRPSGADTWLQCTASPRLILDNSHRIVEKFSKYADEGSEAHERVAEAIKQGVKIDDEDLQYYVDFCLNLWFDADMMSVEQKVPLFYDKNSIGIVDFFCVIGDTLYIIDLKWGKNVLVSPIDNKQMIIYAESVICHYELSGTISDVRIGIYQPRAKNSKKQIEFWDITSVQLAFKSAGIEQVVNSIRSNKDTVFYPSESVCRWCPAKPFCKSYQKFMSADSLDEFTDLTLKDEVSDVPIEELVEIAKKQRDVKKYFSIVEGFLIDSIKNGKRVPGAYLETGKGSRKWKDEVLAETYMKKLGLNKKERYVEKLISPAHLFKIRKEEKKNPEVDKLIIQDDTQPKLKFGNATETIEDFKVEK